MEGWKTKWAGIGMILTGLGMCVGSITWEPFSINGDMFSQGCVVVSGGLGLIGWGHKTDKLKQAIEKNGKQ